MKRARDIEHLSRSNSPRWHRLLALLRMARSPERIRAELDEEFRFHIEMHAAELTAAGMSPADAAVEARRRFGDLDFARRYCERADRLGDRSVRTTQWLGELRQDLRHTARSMRRNVRFSLVAVTTLALGIGANAAVFSVLETVLLQRAPFPHPDRLVAIDEGHRRTGGSRGDIAAGEYLAWANAQTSFTGIAAHGFRSLIYSEGARPEILAGKRVSANFFDVLGVRAAIGRTFVAGEDAGSHRVVILTDGIWRRVFGGDSSIVGRQVPFGGDSYTVVGVLPPTFVFPGATPTIFTTVDFTRAMADVARADRFHFLHAFGRLRPGVSIETGRADLLAIAHRRERENPNVSTDHLVTVLPLATALTGDIRPTLFALMGAAGFVLLIACANIANLTLARAVVRRREYGVRVALGAGRGRLIRQTLTESLVLALLGGACGVTLAWLGTPVMLAIYPGALPPNSIVHMQTGTVLFSFVVASTTGIVFGLVPAFAATSSDIVAALRDDARGTSVGRFGRRTRGALAVAQVALAMVLLVGAGLLIRTLVRLNGLRLGFEPSELMTMWVPLSGPRYQEPASIVAFWDRLLDRLGREPIVSSVSVSGSMPFRGGSGAGLAIDGRPVVGPLPEVRYTTASEDFFRTLGTPILRGRGFAATDRSHSGNAVVVNQALARKFWPNGDAIGSRVRLGPDSTEPWATVVGVAGDYRQESLDADPPPLAITNHRQDVWSSMFVAVRSSHSPSEVDAVMTRVIRELDPAIPVEHATPMRAVIGDETARRRFALSLLAAFAGVALTLAVVGVYGIVAHGVAARRREFGIRIAVGALPRQLLSLVLVQGLSLAVAGVVVGFLLAFPVTRLLESLLFGIGRFDAVTFGTVALLLIGASAAACLLPARDAATADPASVLQSE